METLLLLRYALVITSSISLILKILFGICDRDFSISKKCFVVFAFPGGIFRLNLALPGMQISLQTK